MLVPVSGTPDKEHRLYVYDYVVHRWYTTYYSYTLNEQRPDIILIKAVNFRTQYQ